MEWIIPARAGFTQCSIMKVRAYTDHPRSRGVYSRIEKAPASPVGSSPLARGLLPVHTSRVKALRIIPARAGFTRWVRSHFQKAADHPRSRGVYSNDLVVRDAEPGSSPLARGLPKLPERGPKSGTDHPRSRGVYTTIRSLFSELTGSSPLARGLRRAVRVLFRPGRIIPARAGFTPKDSGSRFAGSDHPRSRGVYL